MRFSESDQAFRVKIVSLDQETGKERTSYAGPYATRPTAKGQATRLRSDYESEVQWRLDSFREIPRYLKTFTLQESQMDWNDIV